MTATRGRVRRRADGTDAADAADGAEGEDDGERAESGMGATVQTCVPPIAPTVRQRSVAPGPK
jgi:hypothetical protein